MQGIESATMKKLDEEAVKSGLKVKDLMEKAGEAVADVARKILKDAARKEIIVLCGKGNNGGDGLVAARHLAQDDDARVLVMLACDTDSLVGAAKEEYQDLFVDPIHALDVSIMEVTAGNEERIKGILESADLIIDALLGLGMHGSPHGVYAQLINAAHESGAKILAVDLPTGLDPDTGRTQGICINADATVTMGAVNLGLITEAGRRHTGTLYIADLGIPAEVYEKAEVEMPEFKDSVFVVPKHLNR
jgi:ADP-dependent NAD(P)H-hydrate dehydratase / NAD(P)H-hydrate epimerase